MTGVYQSKFIIIIIIIIILILINIRSSNCKIKSGKNVSKQDTQGLARALKSVLSYTIPIVHEIKSNNTL